MKRPVEECWNIYADGILPPDALPAKREALRASFYCGVYSLRQLLAKARHENGEEEEEEKRKRKFREIIEQVDDELHEFIAMSHERATQMARQREGESDGKEA